MPNITILSLSILRPHLVDFCKLAFLDIIISMDKTPIPSNINLRSKGLSRGYGKLHKGCVKDATTKLSIGSIPSTYESIIYKS